MSTVKEKQMKPSTKLLAVLIGVMFFFIASSLHADSEQDKADIVKHLEFIGYSVSVDGNKVVAKSNGLIIVLQISSDKVRLSTSWALTEYGKGHYDDIMNLLNGMTYKSTFSKFYLDKESPPEIIVTECYYQMPYEKERFGRLMTLFVDETQNLFVRQILAQPDMAKWFK